MPHSAELLAASEQLSGTGSFFWKVAVDELVCSTQVYCMFELPPSSPATWARLESRVEPADLPPFRAAIQRARRSREDFEQRMRLRTSTGSVKYVHLVARGTGRGSEYVGAIRDVTEQRLSNQLLDKARSELAHVNRTVSLGVISASIAHEINQPLAGIITNANSCLRLLGAEPPNLEGARETARRTIHAGNRAADVTARLRALFSRRQLTTEAVDLNEVTREVLELSLSDLRRNRVQVRQQLAGDLPLVSGDRVQLQQVVLNLLLNASDAMAGVDDRPRELRISTTRDGAGRVMLSACDSGTGFEPHTVEELFEAFYTTKSSGMGIGLSVSRSIIEGHGGRLWASLNDGPGATFSFSLPRLA